MTPEKGTLSFPLENWMKLDLNIIVSFKNLLHIFWLTWYKELSNTE